MDHFSGLLTLRAFARKVQGPVAAWFQDVITKFNSMLAAHPEAVCDPENAVINFASNTEDNFLDQLMGYQHTMQGANSVSLPLSFYFSQSLLPGRIMAASLRTNLSKKSC